MSVIIDHRGKLFEKEVLAQPQTSQLGSLYHEFSAHPSRGLTPAKLARILEDAEHGDLLGQCDLFDDMEEKDTQIYSEMSKRKRALMTLEWDIEPPMNATAEEKRATGLVKELLSDMPDFEDAIFDALDAVGKAFSAIEYEWTMEEKIWRVSSMEQRPQRWFMTPLTKRNSIRLRNGSAEGDELNPFGWLLHTHKARSGYISRTGLLRTLSWPYLFKNYSLRDLAEFLEIYGLPLRLGQYPEGASDSEKATLLQAVMSIGHHAAGIIPKGMQIDFQNAADGSEGPFQAMINWCERSISKCILGATLTTEVGSSGGNRALGQVHQDVMWDIVISDAKQLAGTLTRDLVYPHAALNVAGINHPSRSPRFVFDLDTDDNINPDTLPKLVAVGMKIPEKYARKKLKIPEPVDGEAVLEMRKPSMNQEKPPATAALKSQSAPADISDKQAEQLEAETAQSMNDMIAQVRSLLDGSDSLEDFRDRLLQTWPDMDSAALANAMREALVAATLAGRYDILEEAGGRS